VEEALQVATRHMDSTGRPYALIMKKGAVAPYPLKQTSGRAEHRGGDAPVTHSSGLNLPSRHDALRQLVADSNASETVLIASTGFNGRELYAIEDRPNQLYMVGSMGCAASFGLGLSLVRPDKKVIVVDGDGAVLMRLGNMATVGLYGGDNFFHLLLDNHVHESTGGQATVSSVVDFQAVANACGYQSVSAVENDCREITGFLQAGAPALMLIETCQGVPEGLPRPSIKPADVARRLMRHLGVNTAWISVE
jgi:phosphonopyruvate decarboxylase